MTWALPLNPVCMRGREGKDPQNRREAKIGQAGEGRKSIAPFFTSHFPEESIPVGAKEKPPAMPYKTPDYIRKMNK